MAGDWIKMRNDLSEDPAVIGIAALTGTDEFSVIGRLQAIWSWADRQSRDGHAAYVTSAWLNRKVQCDGFAEAMVKVGWLVVDETGITFPKFGNHNGDSAKTRALGTNRKQKQRSNAVVSEAVTHESTDVSRSERDKSETREEKRREIHPLTPKGEPEGFTAFWASWPKSERKEAKGQCLKAWTKGKCELVAMDILRHVEHMKRTPNWLKDNGQFVPAPLVYLNGRRWEGAETGPAQSGLQLVGGV
jgi:hypothetical protein